MFTGPTAEVCRNHKCCKKEEEEQGVVGGGGEDHVNKFTQDQKL